VKLISVPLAQTIKAVRASHGLGYLPDAVRAVVDRYKFVEFPTQPHEFLPADPNQPTSFRHGKIEIESRTVVIAQLQVYQMGFVVNTDTNTTDSDWIADDILHWASSHFEITFEPIRPVGHLSQLEVQFEKRIADFFPALKAVSAGMSKGLDDFWEFHPSYELASLTFSFDPSLHPSLVPAFFKIEPRVNIAFEENIYFSEAPLSTDNHVTLLERFERVCLESAK
jgi:hypothetical protein